MRKDENEKKENKTRERERERILAGKRNRTRISATVPSVERPPASEIVLTGNDWKQLTEKPGKALEKPNSVTGSRLATETKTRNPVATAS